MPDNYKLVTLPDFGFIIDLDEASEDVDIAEYFMDSVHQWVMDTHPDDVRERITVEDV